MENNELLCGCGYGKPTHYQELYKDKFILHVLGFDTCCREIATGNNIPSNFRKEMLIPSHTEPVDVCDVNGITITVYTLTNQRGYDVYPDGTWSMLKNKDSINSIGDNW